MLISKRGYYVSYKIRKLHPCHLKGKNCLLKLNNIPLLIHTTIFYLLICQQTHCSYFLAPWNNAAMNMEAQISL